MWELSGVARSEGLSEEALVMACLLHDVGYPECRNFEELGKHPAYGAEIARRFLEKIGYDRAVSESICSPLSAAIFHRFYNSFVLSICKSSFR